MGCFIMCIILASAEAFTLYVLSKMAERYQGKTYGTLVRKALGKKLSAALSIVMLLYLWGSCIAYLVIIGDSFSPLLKMALGDHALWLADRRVLIVLISAVVITPLCMPRDLNALEWVSMAAVIGFIYTAIAIVVRAWYITSEREAPFQDIRLFKFDFGALFALPIIVFGFNCHANVVTIFTELERHPDVLVPAMPHRPDHFAAMEATLAPRPRTRKMIGMMSVIIAAITLIILGYLAVGFSGYLAFPTTVSSNALNNFPDDDVLMQIAKGVIGLVVVGHYPLNHHPARLAGEDLERQLLGWNTISRTFSVTQSLFFIWTSVAVSVVVSDLGAVLHMVGGTAASFMIFFLPGMMLINAAIVKRSNEEDLESNSNFGGVGGEESSSEAALPDVSDVTRPMLADPQEKGLKRVGLVYSPRKSWWAGVVLVALSITIFVITILTAIL